jgi:Triosephosphate isomerase
VQESITSIVKNLNAAQLDSTTEVVISPPSLYLTLTRSLADSKIGVAAQNVFDKPNGAFTGEISVEQLRDTKIDWVVIGHSERRVILKESDEVCDPAERGTRQKRQPSYTQPTAELTNLATVHCPQGQGCHRGWSLCHLLHWRDSGGTSSLLGYPFFVPVWVIGIYI